MHSAPTWKKLEIRRQQGGLSNGSTIRDAATKLSTPQGMHYVCFARHLRGCLKFLLLSLILGTLQRGRWSRTLELIAGTRRKLMSNSKALKTSVVLAICENRWRRSWRLPRNPSCLSLVVQDSKRNFCMGTCKSERWLTFSRLHSLWVLGHLKSVSYRVWLWE